MAFGVGPQASFYHKRAVAAPPPTPEPKPKRARRVLRVVLAIIILAFVVLAILISRPKLRTRIHSFRECVDYGYPVLDTTPQTCNAPEDGTFTNETVDQASTSTKTNLLFTIMVDSAHGAPDRLSKVIGSQKDWDAYWAKAHAHLPAMPQQLPVDFTKEMVAAIQLGTVPSDGYRIKITDIYSVDREVVIMARKTTPGKGCVLPPLAGQAPYEIVRFPRTTKPTVFNIESSTTADCASSDPGTSVGRY